MKLLIAIPSKGRASSIYKKTLRWAVRTGFDVRVFVEPQEIKEYRDAANLGNYDNYTDVTDEHFVDIEKTDQGLGYAKQFIKDYATKNGYDLVFKMDDDVLRFTGRGRAKPDEAMIMDFAEMVATCRSTFGKYPDVGAIGFPYSFELWEVKEWTALNARLQTCYIIRTDLIQSGFNALEDFAQYVYLRSLNKVTLRYGKLGIACTKIGSNVGGHQAFDREALTNEEMPKLREIYPALKFKPVKGKTWSIEPDLTGEFFGVKKI